MMDLKYVGEGSFSLKYKGRMIPFKNGTVVKDLDKETADDLSNRKVNGEKQWVEASTPKKLKKGEA